MPSPEGAPATAPSVGARPARPGSRLAQPRRRNRTRPQPARHSPRPSGRRPRALAADPPSLDSGTEPGRNQPRRTQPRPSGRDPRALAAGPSSLRGEAESPAPGPPQPRPPVPETRATRQPSRPASAAKQQPPHPTPLQPGPSGRDPCDPTAELSCLRGEAVQPEMCSFPAHRVFGRDVDSFRRVFQSLGRGFSSRGGALDECHSFRRIHVTVRGGTGRVWTFSCGTVAGALTGPGWADLKKSSAFRKGCFTGRRPRPVSPGGRAGPRAGRAGRPAPGRCRAGRPPGR